MECVSTNFASAKVTLRRQDGGSWEVAAEEWIAPGEVVAVFGGRVVTLADLRTRAGCRALQIDDDFYLLSGEPSDVADHINHSCDPNLGLRGALSLVALRPIAPGEAVCYDYAMTDGSDYDEFVCQCGAPSCRGKVTGEDWRLPDLQQRYHSLFSPYLKERIHRLTGER
jgi:hypothetical protein